MITRIVKLKFRKEEVETFQNYFKTVCETIRNQPGCNKLEAWHDINDPGIFFTYSTWDTEQQLNDYRDSAFFLQFWKTVKVWFEERAEVWSFDVIIKL